MTEGTKANIGYACVAAFVAGLIGFGMAAADQRRAYDAIGQYDATTFRTSPTEVIYPKFGAVGIWWDGTWTVIDQVTWLDMTGAYGYEYSKHSSDEHGASGR